MERLGFKKTEHITFLRAIATIAVVLYHSRPSVDTGVIPHNLIALIFNWCVPVFFMISGALFLNSEKQVDFKYMLNKTLHIIKIIFVWGFIYNIISTVVIERTITLKIFLNSILMIFKADTTYCYQFWYLYVLIGVYSLIPLLKPWIEKFIKSQENLTSDCVYMFCCWLILAIVVPTICDGFGISSDIWLGAFKCFSGYLFFVICGRLYECIDGDKRYNIFFYIILTTFIAQFIFFVTMIFIGKYDVIESWYGYESFFTWNMSSVLYLLIKKVDFSKINSIAQKIYTVIAKYSLHIYILHVIVLQIIRKLGFTNDLINPWVYPIINVTITVLICLLIAYICKKIPVIKHLF